jgi:hypothetical protein
MAPLRSIAAIVVGLAFMLTFAGMVAPVLGALAGVAGFLGANGMAAVIAGWLAARIAGYAELAHAIGLAAILAIGTLMAASGETPPHQPGWYVPVAGVVGVAGVLAGGWLRSAAAEAARP